MLWALDGPVAGAAFAEPPEAAAAAPSGAAPEPTSWVDSATHELKKVLGRECSQECFCIEDFPGCCSARDFDIASDDALCRLDNDWSSDRINFASRGDRATLLLPPTNLYFHQKLLC